MDAALSEILVVPFFGQGHLNPCTELCKRIASHHLKAIFIIPSNLSSSVPSTFHHHSCIEVVEIPNSSPPPEMANGSGLRSETGPESESGSYPPHHYQDLVEGTESFLSGKYYNPVETRPGNEPVSRHPAYHRHYHLVHGIESFLSERYSSSGQTRPRGVVVDVMMSWSKEFFRKLNIPIVTFFTSGACFSAMEYAMWKNKAEDMKPGETRTIAWLPEDMTLSYADIKRHQRRNGINHGGKSDQDGPGSASGPPGRKSVGPPGPVKRIPWWEDAESSSALLFNTCDDLDGPFIKYIANEIGKPVWGVGPMLPEQYWKSAGSVVHDHEVRSKGESNLTEDEVLQWLDSKPIQSVIYISFGSEVGPTMKEYAELANALEESNRPFIWVILPGSGIPGPPRSILGQNPYSLTTEGGYYPQGLDQKVGERGLIIKGWAPQLLILSHPSVGGFVSHCGWNSTVEAIGRGVPILAWPINGDQFYNAKLIVHHLKVGHNLLKSDEYPLSTMKKDEIIQGMDMLMDDEVVHKQAMAIGAKFQHGFPASSAASLEALIQLVSK